MLLWLFGYNRQTNYTKRVYVRKIGVILLPILLLILIIFITWDRPASEFTIPASTNATILTDEDDLEEDIASQNMTPASYIISPSGEKAEIIKLSNSNHENHTVSLTKHNLHIYNTEKPITIIHIFATWCVPCIGEIPYLNDLQTKYPDDLFITGVLVNDNIDPTQLDIFIAKNKINYFISQNDNNTFLVERIATMLALPLEFSIPLTLIFVEGNYFTHYEGSVPVEMIEYDLEQAKELLQKR
jgi:thiol-disulfide isomerase/thioredoxin